MIRKLILAFSALCTFGCIEYGDTMKLEEGGKGLFTMHMAIPSNPDGSDSAEDFFQIKELNQRIAAIAGLHLDSMGESAVEGKRSLMVRVRFDSLPALAKLGGPMPTENFIGSLSLVKDKDSYVYERVLLANGNGAPEEAVDGKAQDMMDEVLGNIEWTYDMQVPGRIAEAPGAAAVDTLSGKVSWKFKAAEVSRRPLHMKVRYSIPPAQWGLGAKAGLGATLLVLVAGMWLLQRKVRRLAQVVAERPKA